jgi:allantoicase
MYHDGNQVEWVELYADGKLMLEKTQLFGHSLRKIKLLSEFKNITEVEVRAYPDGGLSRVGLYSNKLPQELADTFTGEANRYTEEIPHPTKPLGIDPNSFKTETLVGRVNYASLALGAKVLSATDEHYAPAINVISPFSPLNMFDGLESKRSRVEGHKEQVVIELAKEIEVGSIQFDFTYFVNNNPVSLSVEYSDAGEWKELFTNYPCKAYAANILEIPVKECVEARELRFSFFPDGGVNRIKVFSK